MKGKTIPQIIGEQGEERICGILAAIPNTQLYRNVNIPRKNGSTLEIDAILLSPKGLLIIECKTFLQGVITGSMQRYEWTRAYKKKGTRSSIRTKFYNPIKQNAVHVEAAVRVLGVSKKA